MNNNINLDEIRKLANMIDVFANCLQQDINQHCDEREKGHLLYSFPTGTPTVENVEQVVRCKDCLHFEDATVNAKGFLILPEHGHGHMG